MGSNHNHLAKLWVFLIFPVLQLNGQEWELGVRTGKVAWGVGGHVGRVCGRGSFRLWEGVVGTLRNEF